MLNRLADDANGRLLADGMPMLMPKQQKKKKKKRGRMSHAAAAGMRVVCWKTSQSWPRWMALILDYPCLQAAA